MAKANKLDLEIAETDTSNPTPQYLKLNKLSKVPTFVGSDGYVLSESMAIAIYGRLGSDTLLASPQNLLPPATNDDVDKNCSVIPI